MNVPQRFANVLFLVASIATTGAWSAPSSTPVGTLTVSAPFGSSPVLAWSWGASNSSTLGGGSGGGKANLQDLSLTRHADAQSPLFFNAVLKGQHLASVVLVDGSTTITLTGVLVTSYSAGNGSPDGKSAPRTENITFTFTTLTYAVSGASTCFNVVTQASC